MLNRDPSLQHVLDSIAKQHEGNDEARMSNAEGNDQMTESERVLASAKGSFVIGISSLIRHSSFVIRHCGSALRRDS
jgi:hypothetical protein